MPIALAALLALLIGMRAARRFPKGNDCCCRHHRVWLDTMVH